jgi:hypothetical protein
MIEGGTLGDLFEEAHDWAMLWFPFCRGIKHKLNQHAPELGLVQIAPHAFCVKDVERPKLSLLFWKAGAFAALLDVGCRKSGLSIRVACQRLCKLTVVEVERKQIDRMTAAESSILILHRSNDA